MGKTDQTAPQGQSSGPDEDKRGPLNANDAVKQLNDLNLGIKFEKTPDGAGVRTKLEGAALDNLQNKDGNNPYSIQQLFGQDFKIQGEESTNSKRMKSAFGFGGAVSNFMKKDQYLEGYSGQKSGVLPADIDLITKNAEAIRDAVGGHFDNEKTAYLAAHAPAGGDAALGTKDPQKISIITDLNGDMDALKGGVAFKATGADEKITTQLTDQQAQNLEAVINSPQFKTEKGKTAQQTLFGTDSITYDSATKSVTVDSNITTDDLKKFDSNNSKFFKAAVDGEPVDKVNAMIKFGGDSNMQKGDDLRHKIPFKFGGHAGIQFENVPDPSGLKTPDSTKTVAQSGGLALPKGQQVA